MGHGKAIACSCYSLLRGPIPLHHTVATCYLKIKHRDTHKLPAVELNPTQICQASQQTSQAFRNWPEYERLEVPMVPLGAVHALDDKRKSTNTNVQ